MVTITVRILRHFPFLKVSASLSWNDSFLRFLTTPTGHITLTVRSRLPWVTVGWRANRNFDKTVFGI